MQPVFFLVQRLKAWYRDAHSTRSYIKKDHSHLQQVQPTRAELISRYCALLFRKKWAHKSREWTGEKEEETQKNKQRLEQI